MPTISLPPRLLALAELVPAGSRVADVGSDHGLMPAWLRQRNQASFVLATDIVPGPLEAARRMAAAAGADGIRFLQCDGLDGIERFAPDVVVIAGMGGETIAGILERSPWATKLLLLLQPMTTAEELRRRLPALHLRIRRESMVSDGGRLYQIIEAVGGAPPPYTEAELYTGLFEQIGRDPLFPRRLRELTEKTVHALEGLERSASQHTERLHRLRIAHHGFLRMQKMIQEDFRYADGKGNCGLL
jgi:tRNA (adenine22-N1)-methyltransferase